MQINLEMEKCFVDILLSKLCGEKKLVAKRKPKSEERYSYKNLFMTDSQKGS